MKKTLLHHSASSGTGVFIIVLIISLCFLALANEGESFETEEEKITVLEEKIFNARKSLSKITKDDEKKQVMALITKAEGEYDDGDYDTALTSINNALDEIDKITIVAKDTVSLDLSQTQKIIIFATVVVFFFGITGGVVYYFYSKEEKQRSAFQNKLNAAQSNPTFQNQTSGQQPPQAPSFAQQQQYYPPYQQ